ALEELKSFREVAGVVELNPTNLRVYLNKVEEIVPQIMKLFLRCDLPILSINMSEPSLDDVFVHYTGLTIEEAQQKAS
ncbi:MAG: DUF4162 domain-containing protein, partial [Candidatus Bathyarchaeota archaeon]|nr:DUF4162 domain-containing protein [Candidatus Bathyarchaeota archaeon]